MKSYYFSLVLTGSLWGVAYTAVTAALQALVGRYPGWGFWKYHHRLRKNGLVVNHKRLWRIYQALRLQLGKRRFLRRLPSCSLKQPLQVPATPNVCWSLDFCTTPQKLDSLSGVC